MSDDVLQGTDPLNPDDDAFVAALLAGLDTEPMPADVAARIDAALAAEAAARPTGAAATTVVPLQRTTGAPARRGRLLQLAAGVAVVAVGAVLGVRLIGTGSESGSTADISAAQSAADVPVVQSGTAYSSADFGTQAVALQAATPTPTPMTAAAVPESSGANGYRVQAKVILTTQLADCLKGIDPAHRPHLVDAATYDGDPALVIVYRGANTWDVYAVGTDCTAADAHLLRFVRVPQ